MEWQGERIALKAVWGAHAIRAGDTPESIVAAADADLLGKK